MIIDSCHGVCRPTETRNVGRTCVCYAQYQRMYLRLHRAALAKARHHALIVSCTSTRTNLVPGAPGSLTLAGSSRALQTRCSVVLAGTTLLLSGSVVKSRNDNDCLPWSQGLLLPVCDVISTAVDTAYQASAWLWPSWQFCKIQVKLQVTASQALECVISTLHRRYAPVIIGLRAPIGSGALPGQSTSTCLAELRHQHGF